MERVFKVGGAVGSGVVARAAEEGGADFLIALSAGRMRNMGVPSIGCMLPLARADDMTLSFAEEEVLPRSRLPVYLGVNIWSGAHSHDEIAKTVVDKGFAGASNFPSAIHFSPGMQRLLDAAGQGVEAEISLLSAVRKVGKKTLFYCGTKAQAQRAAEAGLDGIIFNYGWNVGGAVGHKSGITLEQAALAARDVVQLTRSIKSDIEVYLEGGPILTAQDLRIVAETVEIDGYVGGSTIDRFPVQHSVANQIAEYKSAAVPAHDYSKETQDALRRLSENGMIGNSQTLAAFATDTARAARGSKHIALTVETGCDPLPVIDLLTSITGGQQEFSVEIFDFDSNQSVHRINDVLFGREIEGRSTLGLLNTNGAVVLRNAGQMPRLIARKLSTSLRDGRVHRVGRRRAEVLNCKIIFVYDDSAHPDPLPEDLGDRLQVLTLPPLRKRYEDIPTLLEACLDKIGVGKHRPSIQPAAFRLLTAHRWQRNEAELSELAVRIAGMAIDRPIEAHDIQPLLESQRVVLSTTSADEVMRQRIAVALVQNGFRKGATAKALHISRKTLYNWMQKLNLR